jgi:hypothetical protein
VAITLRQGREVKALIDAGKRPSATVVVQDVRLRNLAPYGTKSGTSMATPYAAAGGREVEAGMRGPRHCQHCCSMP